MASDTDTGEATDASTAEGLDSGANTESQNNNENSDGNEAENADNQTNNANGKEQDSDNNESEKESETVDIQLSEDSIISDKGQFLDVLKKSTDSQEGFDNLMGYVKDLGEKAQETMKAEEDAKWDKTREAWEVEVKKDPDLGKDYEATIKMANDTAESIGLDKWLTETGFSKSPEVIRAMVKIGRERADAEVVTGNTGNVNKNILPNGQEGFHIPSLDNK